MNTNFFKQIAELDFTGNLQLNIAKGTENKLIVSVLLHNEQCGDNAKNLIPPLVFNAAAEEFDEGFFEQIKQPVEKTSALMVDMEKFQRQLDEAKKQSAMEKEKTEKAKKEQTVKDKKFDEAMAKADELEKQGKFREAWVKVPEPSAYPEKKEIISRRRAELSAKFEPDLFGAAQKEEPKKTEEQHPDPDALYLDYQVETVEEEMEADNTEEQY